MNATTVKPRTDRSRKGPLNPDLAGILRVLRMVAHVTGHKPADFIERGRARTLCHARHLAINLVSETFPDLTSLQIGELFHRDHTAILASYESHARLMIHDPIHAGRHARALSLITASADEIA